MFADLVSVAGRIYQHGVANPADEVPTPSPTRVPTISMHADEFNELIGDEFVPLLNKAGGVGFQVTAYTQTWSDVEAKFGSRAKAGQVAGNFNTMIMLRVKELATAEMLTDQLPRVEVFTLMNVSGVNDSSDPLTGIDFQSRNEDRSSVSEVPMLTPAELVRLPKRQAFALLAGGRLWKVRMPLPDDSGDPAMPASLAAIANEMERTYITNDHWYRARETGWHAITDTDTPAPHETEDGSWGNRRSQTAGWPARAHLPISHNARPRNQVAPALAGLLGAHGVGGHGLVVAATGARPQPRHAHRRDRVSTGRLRSQPGYFGSPQFTKSVADRTY